jgi:GNAT superfamily N-acetyltransferase
MQDRQGGTSAGRPSIRSTGPTDRGWITQFLYDRWAADFVVVHGEVIKPADLPALTCGQGEGLATYRLLGKDAELVTLDAIPTGSGIGTVLVEALAATVIGLGCKRLWLTTTNDKLSALRFYLRRGFRLIHIRLEAVDEARRLKPGIPTIGEFGLPIHDELDLCRVLDDRPLNKGALPPWATPTQ